MKLKKIKMKNIKSKKIPQFKKHPMFKKHPVELSVASICGVGFLPASGTWGALVGLIVAPLLSLCSFLTGLMVVLSFLLGIWAIPSLIKNNKDKDPSYIVIDEFMGQLAVFALLPSDFKNVLIYLLGFALFRLFDILKPWPVSFFDKKMHNAWGIMLDDLMAGIYAFWGILLVRILCLY